MPRVKFIRGSQRKFLEGIIRQSGLNSEEAAGICNVCGRTFRDWRRRKYQMSYDALIRLSKATHISISGNIKILPEFWNIKKAASLGGKRHFELYGAPGTIESRIKGGINSSKRFLSSPEPAKRKGFVIRKKIKYPEDSELLVEFIGIVFGDGGITRYQVKITFNKIIDKEYARYITRLIKKLFSIEPSVFYRKKENTGNITVSSRSLVEFLEKHNIKEGNKKRWDKTPDWIWQNKRYQAAYLRGLMDTDGCIYRHKYRVNNKYYSFAKIAFTSYLALLRETMLRMLKNSNFNPRLYGNRVYLNRRAEVDRYFKEIGTNNQRYLERYNRFPQF